MGAAASRHAPRALVDALESLGGATSAEVLELVDVFARASPAGHVPVTADDVAALSSRSSRRLRTASEVADAFDLPERVAAVLSRRDPPSMTRREAAAARTTAATRSRPRGSPSPTPSCTWRAAETATPPRSRRRTRCCARARSSTSRRWRRRRRRRTATTMRRRRRSTRARRPWPRCERCRARGCPGRRKGSRASPRRPGRSSSGPRARPSRRACATPRAPR